MEQPTNEDLIQETLEAYYFGNSYLADLRKLSARIARGTGGREVSLAITNLQQVGHWLMEAINEMTPKEPTTGEASGEDILLSPIRHLANVKVAREKETN